MTAEVNIVGEEGEGREGGGVGQSGDPPRL